MIIEFPKTTIEFIRNGHTITVIDLKSRKSIDFINQPITEDDKIDTEFLLLGFVTTFPDLELY